MLLDGIEEVAANDVSPILGLPVLITGIVVDVYLRRLVLHLEVVRVLALLAFLADAGLEVSAEDGLGVLTVLKRLLLNKRDTLEEGAE